MKALLTALLSLVSILLASCWGEEDYTLSPHDQLRFSTDTLAFDTIIAGQATSTKTLDIYNDARQALRIRAAYLERGEQSLWRINLDGSYWPKGRGEATHIAAGDSLRLFAEMTAPLTEQDAPQAYEDYLIFELESGVQQRVLLQAVAQEVIPLQGITLQQSTTLSAQRPYQIIDSLVVAQGTTLQLDPGTRLYFHPKSSLIVRGTLKAEGTLESPIVMRGDRLDNMFTQQPYDRIPNQWGGLVFASSSTDNVLTHCDIHSGAFGIRCEASSTASPQLQLLNSIVHNTKSHGLEATGSHLIVRNSQITNAGGNCVQLVGGSYHFTHCTIAQFYPFVGQRGVALFYSNEHQNTPAPLTEARFVNCLIVGNNPDDIIGLPSQRYKEAPFNYFFQNCLLNTPKINDPQRLQHCIFEDDLLAHQRGTHHFLPTFDFERLHFTFTLSPQSPAVGKAQPDAARALPTDRLGRSRLQDSAPDIGCYEAPPPANP